MVYNLNILFNDEYFLQYMVTYIYMLTNDFQILTLLEQVRQLSESKKDGRDQKSIHSSISPDPGYQWESVNFTIRLHKRETSIYNLDVWIHVTLNKPKIEHVSKHSHFLLLIVPLGKYLFLVFLHVYFILIYMHR